MLKRLTTLSFILIAFALPASAQDDHYYAELWAAFNKGSWHTVDFSKQRLTRARLDRIDQDTAILQLGLLRGVVFGKRGRVFKERTIQDYLEKQPWYKPNRAFRNDTLTPTERYNLDLIRLAEAEKHLTVEPGDMRIWQKRVITDDDLGTYNGTELTILIAEIEAIHGKTFPNEEWLQKYFDERYWYKRNPAYSPEGLSDIERKNIERLTSERGAGRNTAIAIGDMDKFHNVLLTEDKLAGLTLLELRILREEFWARAGKKIEAAGIRSFFDWRDWYHPVKDQSKVKLSKIEDENVAILAAYEDKMRQRLAAEPLTDDFLGDLFAEDLRVLRNEIYARHGRIFRDPELQKYFVAQAWYTPNPDFKDEMLSEVESENLKKIKAAEDVAISKFVLVEG